MLTLQPVNGNVLLKYVEKEEEKTSSGIIIPDSAKEKPTDAEVIALSADANDEISVGERVIFKEYSGTKITHDGNEYLLIQQSEILAKYVTVDEI